MNMNLFEIHVGPSNYFRDHVCTIMCAEHGPIFSTTKDFLSIKSVVYWTEQHEREEHGKRITTEKPAVSI
jgi:hypothetical protein